MPNLIEFATVITFHEATDTTHVAENLTSNLENRTNKVSDNPRIYTHTQAAYTSCNSVSVNSISGPFVIGFDHGRVKF